MKTLVFKGALLGRSRKLRDKIDEYLVDVNRCYGISVIDSITWIGHGDSYAELIVRCREGYHKTIIDGVEELQIQERLAIVLDSLLESLAWKFSSPALTKTFRDIIVPDVTGDNKLSPAEDLK